MAAPLSGVERRGGWMRACRALLLIHDVALHIKAMPLGWRSGASSKQFHHPRRQSIMSRPP